MFELIEQPLIPKQDWKTGQFLPRDKKLFHQNKCFYSRCTGLSCNRKRLDIVFPPA